MLSRLTIIPKLLTCNDLLIKLIFEISGNVMIKSMTAYGRASVPTALGKLVVEIHSVNRKMLDISLVMPKDFLCFDMDLRKFLSQYLERGQISLRITLLPEEGVVRAQIPSVEQLKSLKKAWEKIAKELGFDSRQVVNFHFLSQQAQLLGPQEQVIDGGSMRKVLLTTVETALHEMIQMKQIEGKALAKDMRSRLAAIEKILLEIQSKGKEPLNRYRQKLLERIREVAESDETNIRILHEVALYAEKLDITEELVRLRSHFQQFLQLLETKEKSVGRTLDFLTQEMQRESNTISAKSADTEISTLIVSVKSELEKIREQVQNIE